MENFLVLSGVFGVFLSGCATARFYDQGGLLSFRSWAVPTSSLELAEARRVSLLTDEQIEALRELKKQPGDENLLSPEEKKHKIRNREEIYSDVGLIQGVLQNSWAFGSITNSIRQGVFISLYEMNSDGSQGEKALEVYAGPKSHMPVTLKNGIRYVAEFREERTGKFTSVPFTNPAYPGFHIQYVPLF